jgi:hypothetical protein
VHVAHDHLDGDGFVGRVPGVVVGGHADHRVGELGFARELGFGEAGHVDAGAGPGAVEVGFGPGGELGSFCRGLGSLSAGGDGKGRRSWEGEMPARGYVLDMPKGREGGRGRTHTYQRSVLM